MGFGTYYKMARRPRRASRSSAPRRRHDPRNLAYNGDEATTAFRSSRTAWNG